jgi:pantetheine-phosphate adenylyltransferase
LPNVLPGAALRIVAGSARGIRLTNVPEGVRPTSDRVREAVFNSLGQFFDGGEVLDLYAGTGALGIEALSRGCERATFVERNGTAVRTIRENLSRAGFAEDSAQVVRGVVGPALERLVREERRFRLIFADPPYSMARAEIEVLVKRLPDLLAPHGRAVVESGESVGVAPEGLAVTGRRYGGTVVTYFEWSGEGAESALQMAICPGSFDPVTSGHVDVISRAAGLFDHVIVAVGKNIRKGPKLPAEDRVRLIEKVTRPLENVSVEVMDGLLVDFARVQGAQVVVKGLRAVSDFESEFQQAQLNRGLYPELETVYLMAVAEHMYLSSSAVREIASHGGSVGGLVPDEILETVQRLYSGG